MREAVEEALASTNMTARMRAVLLLADLEVYKQGGEEDWRERMRQAMVDARARLEARINQRAVHFHRRGQSELAQEFTKAAAELWASGEKAVTSEGLVVGDVSTREAEAVLQGLADLGLIAPPGRVRELEAEVERLKRVPAAVREEFDAD